MKDPLYLIGSALDKVNLTMEYFVLNQEMDSDTDQDLALLKYLPEWSPVRAEIIA